MNAFVQPMTSASSVPYHGAAMQVRGHTIYRDRDNDAQDCSFTSAQGATGNGGTEMVFMGGHNSRRVAGFCAQVATAFARYLTVAGLR